MDIFLQKILSILNISKVMSDKPDKTKPFPFNTCEVRGDIVDQPYSASINVLSCIILLYLLSLAKHLEIQLFIASLFVFQAYHAYSHMFWSDNEYSLEHVYIIHAISYIIIVALINAISFISGELPNIPIIFGAILLDIYILYNYIGTLYNAISGINIWVIVLITGLWNVKLPAFAKQLLPILLMLFAVIIALFFNEKYNCSAMMDTYVFPYHTAIEICGLIISSLFAYIFILLEIDKS
jgi:hypothetical protein